MFRATAAILSLAMTSACYAPPPDATYASRNDAATDSGVVGLAVMSNWMMAIGAPGLLFMPLLMAASVQASNDAMEQANAKATIGQTYAYAYNRDINNVSASGNTGQLFRDMKSATAHFQRVLVGHRMQNPQDFVLTAVRTADTQGYTLYALVHRPFRSITVRTADGSVRTLTAKDDAFYRTYRTDAQGRMIDVVVDWAGVHRSSISTQKGQAVLLTLGANSVLSNRRSNEYWSIEQRWQSGQYAAVVAERKREIERRLAVK